MRSRLKSSQAEHYRPKSCYLYCCLQQVMFYEHQAEIVFRGNQVNFNCVKTHLIVVKLFLQLKMQSKYFCQKNLSKKILFCLKKKIWVNKKFLVKKIIWSKTFLGPKNFFWVKNVFGSKKILVKKTFGQKDLEPTFFCLKNQVGLTQGKGFINPPPPENNRVKIVLGCYQFCQERSHTKFQTPRIILSSRSRVPWWVGEWLVGG